MLVTKTSPFILYYTPIIKFQFNKNKKKKKTKKIYGAIFINFSGPSMRSGDQK